MDSITKWCQQRCNIWWSRNKLPLSMQKDLKTIMWKSHKMEWNAVLWRHRCSWTCTFHLFCYSCNNKYISSCYVGLRQQITFCVCRGLELIYISKSQKKTTQADTCQNKTLQIVNINKALPRSKTSLHSTSTQYHHHLKHQLTTNHHNIFTRNLNQAE